MWEEDENDLAVFEFYKKLPTIERKDCEVFITPEKIYQIQQANTIAVENLMSRMIVFREMEATIIRSLIIKGEWKDYTIFKRVVKAIKEYYQLRPEVIEKYPELLI